MECGTIGTPGHPVQSRVATETRTGTGNATDRIITVKTVPEMAAKAGRATLPCVRVRF